MQIVLEAFFTSGLTCHTRMHSRDSMHQESPGVLLVLLQTSPLSSSLLNAGKVQHVISFTYF